MAQFPTHDAENARARRERITQLVLRRTKLDAGETALLREVFPEILDAHHDEVWNQLRRRRIDTETVEYLVQEVFVALYKYIVEHGFPDHFPGLRHTITERRLLNHVRDKKRTPVSSALPSSGSEKPTSEPDVERALDLRELSQRLLPKLSPEHHEVVEMVILNGLSYADAADTLGIPEGTVKSRMIAAKHALIALAEVFLPPSQRGST